MDSANSQTEYCQESGCLEDDKEIASAAVSFVINGVRKGAVHLCASIAELLRENRRLKKTVEAQKAHIRLLRSSSTQACTSSCCSTPSLSVTQDTGISSSCSSGRGSLSPGFHLPGLPPLTANHQRAATVQPPQERNEGLVVQIPLLHPCPNSPRFSRRHSQDGSAKQNNARVFGRAPDETLPPDKAVQIVHRKHKKKQKNISSVHTEDMRIDKDLAKLELNQRFPPTEYNSSNSVTEGTDTREANRGHGYTKLTPCLKMNDRVVLDTKEKGTVRFIGHLGNTNATDVYIGVELDGTRGECDGTFNGVRYFKCKANHGTFTTALHIRKLSTPQARPPDRTDSSDSDRGGPSSRMPNSRLRRTKNQMNISAVVHGEPETRIRGRKDTGSP